MGFYVLGVFSKEMAITLPAVLLVWEVVAHHREGSVVKRVVAPLRDQPLFWGILWAGAIAFFVYRGILLPRSFNPTWWGGSAAANFATVLVVHLRYLQVQVIPLGLLADYSPNSIEIARGFGRKGEWVAKTPVKGFFSL